MPFCKCPGCGASHHMSVSVPVKEWYAEHCPDTPVTEAAPIPCMDCFKKDSAGWEEKLKQLKLVKLCR